MDFTKAYKFLLVGATRVTPSALPRLVPALPEDEWADRWQAVAHAAGAGATAYQRWGGRLSARGPAYAWDDLDPMLNWQMSLKDPNQLKPEDVITSVTMAQARSASAAADASTLEHGLRGLLAGFLRWPSDLREAVGPDDPAQQRVAGLVGVAGQIIIGTITAGVGGALTTGLVVGSATLWRVIG